MKFATMKFAALSAALFASFVLAEEAPVAAPAAIVKHSCVAPEMVSRMASQNQQTRFNKKFKEYGDCVKKFLDEQTEIAKAAQASGNAAIAEYNAFVKQVQEQQAQ